MKKSKFLQKFLSLALVLVMMVSLVPMSVLAAVRNDIVYENGKGETGIVNTTLGEKGAINWPIKVYDYLADGMLFEFAQSSAENITGRTDSGTEETGGGQYVLGSPVPYPETATYVTDFTTEAGYNQWFNTAHYQYGGQSGQSGQLEYTKTHKEAVNYESPRSLSVTMKDFPLADDGDFVPIAYFGGGTSGKYTSQIRQMVIVYRAEGVGDKTYDKSAFQLAVVLNDDRSGQGATQDLNTNVVDFMNGNVMTNTNGEWSYVVVDLLQYQYPANQQYNCNIQSVHMSFMIDDADDYVEIAQVAFFADQAADTEAAYEYGENCVEFNNDPGEYISGTDWIVGNNNAFGMRWPSTGYGNPKYHQGGAPVTGSSQPTDRRESGIYASYYTSMMGYQDPRFFNYYTESNNPYNNNRKDGTNSSGQFDGTGNNIGNNGIHYVDEEWNLGLGITGGWTTIDDNGKIVSSDGKSFDTSLLDFGGYDLLTHFTKGSATMGMLESTLDSNGRPVYRQYVVEYIADLLSKTLTIPQKNVDGKNIYTYVAGVKNGEQYGYDPATGEAFDLAQALRHQLGINFDNVSAATNYRGTTPEMGDFTETKDKAGQLIGSFKDCVGNIDTCMDAAYYLLHNLYVPDSYNQTQDDFKYLSLTSATLDNGTEAFVFDGGFTTEDAELIEDGTSQEAYKELSGSSVVYDTDTDTISLGNKVNGKDLYYYDTSSDITTRFPFLPVVDSEGVYEGQSDTYYFAENGKRSYDDEFSTYQDRNFNYTLVSNGEFVFREEDELFFEFEGDDDVYLFINGELVLDLGGAHPIATCALNVNDYVYWARDVLNNPDDYTAAEIARAEAFDLEDGEIASFDFFYMERHGYGANMRIVTNMHITDPGLRVDKRAYQGGTELAFGDIIDGNEPVEYSFDITNNGNLKLYNLAFEDSDIGVTLDPEKGLLVRGDDTLDDEDDINGYLVTDATGGRLEASDLTAVVTGYMPVESGGDYLLNDDHTYTYVADGSGTHKYVEVVVTFDDNEALKNFLHTLQAEGTDDSSKDDVLTQSGSGLWVDTTLSIRGIYYSLTSTQREEGVFNNTVYVTSTTRSDPNDASSETLKSNDRHRVYLATLPYYYQWAENDLFIDLDRIYQDSAAEATNTGSVLYDYREFFNGVNDISEINVSLCGKLGQYVDQDNYYPNVKSHTDASGTVGYKVNYSQAGTYEFYLFMRTKAGENRVTAAGLPATDPGNYTLGEYAIVRVITFVADVEDSVFVLDYGLKTENLDKNGELFKNDELLGGMTGTVAKMMGATLTAPWYNNVLSGTSEYNYISFEPMDLSSDKHLEVMGDDGYIDGYFNFNVDIPEHGKPITYNAHSGYYSLTDTGTITVHVECPYSWDDVSLYYWYDNGYNNGWPGEPMNKQIAGVYTLEIPSNVPHIIVTVNRDIKDSITGETSTVMYQTSNIDINPGEEVWVKLTDDEDTESGKLISSVSYKTTDGTIHAKVPEDWGDVYIYTWDDFGNGLVEWPGTKLEADENGMFTATIPGDITNVIINNGLEAGKQTVDLVVYAGKEIWITVGDTPAYSNNEKTIDYYTAVSSLADANDTVTMNASVPSYWGEDIYIYYWNSNGSYAGHDWPGVKMTKDNNGWFVAENLPGDISNAIINNGVDENGNNRGYQTVDLITTPGLDAWFNIESVNLNASVEATVPSTWTDVNFYFCDSVGAVTDEWPGTPVTDDNGVYRMDVPERATHLIINNGKIETMKLSLAANTVNRFTVAEDGSVTSPDATRLVVYTHGDVWDEVALHMWNTSDGSSTTWPGVVLTNIQDDGGYVYELPSNYNAFLVNNNDNGVKTVDILYPNYFLGQTNIIDVYADNGHNLTTGDYVYSAKSNATIVYGDDADAEGFNFVPTDFMDSLYNMWMAITVHEKDMTPSDFGSIDIGREVQLYKKITVLPANVVYYEDDFTGLDWSTTTSSVVTHYGAGSGSLSQSVDQTLNYGNDAVYQGSENAEITGSSLTDILLKDNSDLATFTFRGTGFEIIGHTHAVESGTMMVTVTAEDGTVTNIPVITEFDNNADGGKDSIASVPIIRVSGLEYGQYTVTITGVPVFDFSDFDWGSYNGDPSTLPVKTACLCVDGVRIFQPLTGTNKDSENGGESTQNVPGQNQHYLDTESGAGFSEVRNLIADRQAFAVKYSEDDGLTLSGGTTTWIENRNNFDPSDYTVSWSGNIVTSVEDYILAGPNNEVYMKECTDTESAAVAFYVTKHPDAKVTTMQIAARAVDYNAFIGSEYTGQICAELQYGAEIDGKLVWKTLANIVTTSEQYYVIPFEECPYDAENDRYQVVLRVADTAVTGMVSLTSLKTNGIYLNTLNTTEISDIIYTDVLGNVMIDGTGTTLDNSKFVDFLSISGQMNSDIVNPDDSEEESGVYTVKFVDYDGTVISTQRVNSGEDAVAPQTPTRENDNGYIFTFKEWDADFTNVQKNLVVFAVYSYESIIDDSNPLGYFEVAVSSGTNFTMSVDDRMPRSMGAEYVNSTMPISAKVTLTAMSSNDSKFIGWIDAATGKVLSSDYDYTFYTSGNDVLVAMFECDLSEVNKVTFYNDKAERIVSVQYYTADDTIVFPEDEVFPGYDFAGWSHTEEQIQASLAAGEDVTVVANWTLQQLFYEINVVNGKVSTHGEVSADGKYMAYKATTVEADKPESGYKFSHWEDEDGNILSFERVYKFYPYRDMSLTAKYIVGSYELLDVIGKFKDTPNVETVLSEKLSVVGNNGLDSQSEYKLSMTGIYTDVASLNTTADAVTVYCINSNEWDAVSAYAWTDGGASNGWPGALMTKTDKTVNGYDVYSVSFDTAYEKVIFNNNNNGQQSADLTLMNGQYFDNKAGVWYTSLDEVPSSDPLSTNVYLAGAFNNWDAKADEFKYEAEGDTVGHLSLELEAYTKYQFKVVKKGAWLGNNGTISDSVTGWVFDASNDSNCTLTTSVAGTYKFTYDTLTDTISVTYPETGEAPVTSTEIYFVNSTGWSRVYAHAWNEDGGTTWPGTIMTDTGETDVNGNRVYAIDFEDNNYNYVIFNNGEGTQTGNLTTMYGKYYNMKDGIWYATLDDVPYVDPLLTDTYLAGDFNEWSEDATRFERETKGDTVAYASVELEANTDYAFKLVDNGVWMGNGGTITDTVTGCVFSRDNNNNCTITTSGAGTYVFAFDMTNNSVSVTYPETEETDPTEPESETVTVYFVMSAKSLGSPIAAYGASADFSEATAVNLTLFDDAAGVYTAKIPVDAQYIFFGDENHMLSVETEGTVEANAIYELTETERVTVLFQNDTNLSQVNMTYTVGDKDYVAELTSNGAYYIAVLPVGVTSVTVSDNADRSYTYTGAIGDGDILQVVTTSEEIEITEDVTTIYFDPSDNWCEAGAWFAVYCYNDSENTWVKASDADKNGIYEARIPKKYTGIIFVRMNPEYSQPGWNDGEKWAQTSNLSLEGNLFTMNNTDSWSTDGSWSSLSDTYTTIYFHNTKDWSDVNLTYGSQMIQMTLSEDNGGYKKELYTSLVPKGTESLTFSSSDTDEAYSYSGEVEDKDVFGIKNVSIPVEYELIADVYVDTTTYGDKNMVVFNWSVPEETGYTFLNAGVLITENTGCNETTLTVNNQMSYITRFVPDSEYQTADGMYSVTVLNVSEGNTMLARAFARYKDENGSIRTVYSDIVTATK